MQAILKSDPNLLAIGLILVCLVIFTAILLFKRKIGDLIDRLWARPVGEVPPVTQQKAEANSSGVTPNVVPESKHALTLATRIVADIENAPVAANEKLRLVSVLAANNILRAEFERVSVQSSDHRWTHSLDCVNEDHIRSIHTIKYSLRESRKGKRKLLQSG